MSVDELKEQRLEDHLRPFEDARRGLFTAKEAEDGDTGVRSCCALDVQRETCRPVTAPNDRKAFDPEKL